ncbi:hypothetical protein OGATHE_003395 [Ogataea polymorpha]|uniref:Secreted protein n=1 Tax=Ogataea polymorpha TaxID=460523 RepID=A0A9P8T414_9ASCO|nr:hypothetical protein OGATHE_003395 [Ogataea polymorpha]
MLKLNSIWCWRLASSLADCALDADSAELDSRSNSSNGPPAVGSASSDLNLSAGSSSPNSGSRPQFGIAVSTSSINTLYWKSLSRARNCGTSPPTRMRGRL